MKTVNIILLAAFFTFAGAAGSFAASEAKIIASDAEDSDYFGYSVAISGDYAIAGANGEDSNGDSAGAAYIYNRTDTNTWDAGTKIVAADAEGFDNFGSSVAISGDYAIVGARDENAGGSQAGAAYIFNRTATNTWDAGTKILAADAQNFDNFGYSVAIDGDYAIVGAAYEDAGGEDAGAAYIYNRTATNTWDAGTKIMAADAQANDYFGYSVAISGDYAIVGAYGEDNGGDSAGAAYIFNRTATNTWDAGTKIVASDAEESDYFGSSVAISGDYAVVGAQYEDAGGSNAGAIYVFHRTATNTWDAGTKIMATDAEDDSFFGVSVAISGPYINVGAYGENAGGSSAGAAYLFSRTGETTWDAGTKITASDAEESKFFGLSVSISGYYAIMGASNDDPGAVSDAGSAYIINHDLPAAIDLLAFEAQWADAGATVTWVTGSETDCGAFTLLRCELGEIRSDTEATCPLDEYRELDLVIPCKDSLYGAEYEVFDATADPTADYAYLLREYETTGGVNDFGPAFLYVVKYGSDAPAGEDDDDDVTPQEDDDNVSDDDAANETEADNEEATEDEQAGCGF